MSVSARASFRRTSAWRLHADVQGVRRQVRRRVPVCGVHPRGQARDVHRRCQPLPASVTISGLPLLGCREGEIPVGARDVAEQRRQMIKIG